MPKIVDLTPAIAMRRYYQERPKRLGLWGTLVLSNLIWLAVVGMLASSLFGLSQLAHNMASKYIRTELELSQAKTLSEKEKHDRDERIARLISYKSKKPLEMVALGKAISAVLDSAPSKYRNFFEQALPEAMEIQVNYAIPASAVMAMAIHESGYGTSETAVKGCNYFGIKAFSNWSGPRLEKMVTRDNGVLTRADFRAYKDMKEGFRGYAEFLKESGRYDSAFNKPSGPEFVRTILHAGYCPDPTYHDNIMQIMKNYNLELLDTALQTTTETQVLASKPKDSPSLNDILSPIVPTEPADSIQATP